MQGIPYASIQSSLSILIQLGVWQEALAILTLLYSNCQRGHNVILFVYYDSTNGKVWREMVANLKFAHLVLCRETQLRKCPKCPFSSISNRGRWGGEGFRNPDHLEIAIGVPSENWSPKPNPLSKILEIFCGPSASTGLRLFFSSRCIETTPSSRKLPPKTTYCLPT